MSTLASLIIQLGLDSAEFQRGMDEAERKAVWSSKNITAGLASIGGTLVTGAVAAGAAAVAGLGAFLVSSTRDAMEAQEVQAQLGAVLKSTGGVAGVTAEAATDLAAGLQKVTRYSDDTILAGENMLLTFTNIGSDIFPEATETMLDMSQALGQDLQSSAIQLGKALQDPILGVTALRRVGVNFNEEQSEMVRQMVESGDLMGAQKFILQELQTEFGGAARAAGGTFGGQLDILNNQFGEVKETVGGALLPILSSFLNDHIMPAVPRMLELANGVGGLITTIADAGIQSAETREALAGLFGEETAGRILAVIGGIQRFASSVIAWIGTAIAFLQNNRGVVVGIFAALGVAIAAWAYTVVIPAIIAVITAALPIVLVLGAVVAAGWLLYQAWTENWGGIRDTLTDFWEGTAKPLFETLSAWLQTNIPIAIQTLKTFWENVLLPAIQKVWTFVQTSVFPLLATLWQWLAVNVPAAAQTLSDFWNTVLLPAFQAVWTFIQTSIIPLYNSLATLMSVAMSLATTALAGLWQNVLQPALEAVWLFIQDNVLPILGSLVDFVEKNLTPVLDWLASNVLGGLKGAFGGISTAISTIIGWIDRMIDKLRSITLPSWLVPGSPTPFEMGLRGISSAMAHLAVTELPRLEARLQLQAGFAGGGQQVVNNYYLQGSYRYESEVSQVEQLKLLQALRS